LKPLLEVPVVVLQNVSTHFTFSIAEVYDLSDLQLAMVDVLLNLKHPHVKILTGQWISPRATDLSHLYVDVWYMGAPWEPSLHDGSITQTQNQPLEQEVGKKNKENGTVPGFREDEVISDGPIVCALWLIHGSTMGPWSS
jgi:hypothetical protein